jgi:hypothetical protein
MTTPSSGPISISNSNTEFGFDYNFNQSLANSNVRKLVGVSSGPISLSNLYNKTWVKNLTGRQTGGRCYSGQSGFSVDRYGNNGDIILTMGVWPTDPPNCQTIPWTYLQFGGTQNAASYPRFTQVWQVNLTSLGVGNSVQTRAPSWPYTLVGYTYIITRNSINSVQITIYPNSWGTGDTGTSISVSGWWNGFVEDFGGQTLTLTWTSLGY